MSAITLPNHDEGGEYERVHQVRGTFSWSTGGGYGLVSRLVPTALSISDLFGFVCALGPEPCSVVLSGPVTIGAPAMIWDKYSYSYLTI